MYPEYADKDGKIGLESLWNVFDEESVLRASGSTESKLSNAEWSLLKRTSAEIEHRKYGRETAGSLVGGRLLHDILVRMDGHVQSSKDVGDDRRRNLEKEQFYAPLKVMLHSAHYPTILGLFAALDATPKGAARFNIPHFAAAIIFELWHTSSGEIEVRVLFRDGDGEDGSTRQ